MKRQLSSSRKRHPCVRPQGLFHLPAVSWEWRRHRETGLGLEPTPVNTEWTRPWWLSCRSSHPLLWDIRPFHCCTGQIVSVPRYVEFGHYLIVHIKSHLKPTQGLQPFLMGKTSISHQWVLVVSPDKFQCQRFKYLNKHVYRQTPGVKHLPFWPFPLRFYNLFILESLLFRISVNSMDFHYL